MLTPAEEAGLAGQALSARVRRALHRLDGPAVAELVARLRAEAERREMFYFHEGHRDTVRILAAPITVLREQLRYIHAVSLMLLNACKRLTELYLADEGVRAILRLGDGEEEWLRACWGPLHHSSNPVLGRMDALVDFRSPLWKETLQFVEPNLHGVGGLHMVPNAQEAVLEVVAPALAVVEPGLILENTSDIRALLVEVIAEHLAAIGRTGGAIALVEPLGAGDGPEDQAPLMRHLRDRYGLTVVHADPSDLRCRGGDVWYGDTRIALAYRDYGVIDLLEIAEEGVDVAPMRQLFRENRMVSSIGAEIDQKACWEVFTDPSLAERYFSSEERHVFQRHILWTRLLGERRTLDPAGQSIDLLKWARAEREGLVLKPNRGYGGEGVVIGPAMEQGEWEAAIDAALADEGDRWVVQKVATMPVYDFPAIDESGELHELQFNVVYGFAPTEDGVGVLTRASQRQVINVAQRGGLAAVLVGHPPTMVPAQ